MRRPWIKFIAALEIIGGIFGVAFTAWAALANRFQPGALILGQVYIGIDVLSLIAGLELWRGRPSGRTASIIVQIIQLPKIVSPAVVFLFSFGLDVWVRIVFGADWVHFGFDSRFLAFNLLGFYVPSAAMDFGVSITAWVFLVILLRYKPAAATETVTPSPAAIESSGQY
jgi:hypothetical protein